MLLIEYFCSSSSTLLKVDSVNRCVSTCRIPSNLINLHATLTYLVRTITKVFILKPTVSMRSKLTALLPFEAT